MQIPEAIVALLKEFGLLGGLFALFFIWAHLWFYWDHKGRIDDLRRENKRLASENLEHRERFERLLGIMIPTKAKGSE